MDHADPPRPVDGVYPKVFQVRDLAGYQQLTWEGVPNEQAGPVMEILETLFVEHGAPLVIKADNGSPFISGDLRALLDRWGVRLLLSPPRTPRYNGSCEAGIGSMKKRTRYPLWPHGTVEQQRLRRGTSPGESGESTAETAGTHTRGGLDGPPAHHSPDA